MMEEPMKRICETCAAFTAIAEICCKNPPPWHDVNPVFGCLQWTPKKRGTCGECEWHSSYNQRLECEFSWHETELPDDSESHLSRGLCSKDCKSIQRATSVDPNFHGCGDWRPKPEPGE